MDGLHLPVLSPRDEPWLCLPLDQRNKWHVRDCQHGRYARCGGRTPRCISASRNWWRGLRRQCPGHERRLKWRQEREPCLVWSHAVLPRVPAAHDRCTNHTKYTGVIVMTIMITVSLSLEGQTPTYKQNTSRHATDMSAQLNIVKRTPVDTRQFNTRAHWQCRSLSRRNQSAGSLVRIRITSKI